MKKQEFNITAELVSTHVLQLYWCNLQASLTQILT